jgi:mRNA m6A methyltransferase non-catalytic subunit
MGVKGVVRRSEDTCFIHSNIDTDIIVAEEPTDIHGHPTGSTEKPIELYEVIDRFCLG